MKTDKILDRLLVAWLISNQQLNYDVFQDHTIKKNWNITKI